MNLNLLIVLLSLWAYLIEKELHFMLRKLSDKDSLFPFTISIRLFCFDLFFIEFAQISTNSFPEKISKTKKNLPLKSSFTNEVSSMIYFRLRGHYYPAKFSCYWRVLITRFI